MLSPLVTETDVRYKLGLRESNLSVYPESFTDVKNITERREARRARERNTSKEGSFRHATRVTRAKLVTRQVTIYIDLLPLRTRMIMSQFWGSLSEIRSNRALFRLSSPSTKENRILIVSSFPGSFNSCVPKLFLSLSRYYTPRAKYHLSSIQSIVYVYLPSTICSQS